MSALIRDSQESPDPRTSLLNTKAAMAAARTRLDALQAPGARVIGTLPREPLMSGDPASSSGTKVDMSELAADVLAAIGSGGGGSPTGPASGDLAGNYPGPTLAQRGANDGDVLTWSPLANDYIPLPAGASSADYSGFFDQATVPTAVQIPTTKWGWWYDTVHAKQYLVRNRGGAMFIVELTL